MGQNRLHDVAWRFSETTIWPDKGLMSQIDTTPPASFALSCPCCAQSVGSPSFEIVADAIGATAIETAILGVAMRHKGDAVATGSFYSAMWPDDWMRPTDPVDLYRGFKVALCHLRKKLKTIGWNIANAGYGQGYFLDKSGRSITKGNGGNKKSRKLTDYQVQLIRLFASEGSTASAIARELGIPGKETVRSIIKGMSYRDVA